MTTSGALLLFQPEYFRATHGTFYQHTDSAHPVTATQAVGIVHQAHPDFAISWVNKDHGIFEVGDATYNVMYGVNPGTGDITGLAHRNDGVYGFLENLHECAFSCEGYPGYAPFLAKTVPTLGISWLTGLTWAGILLGALGLLLVFLAVTGIVTWWPGFRRLSHGFRVRTGRGRFARDYDLHRAVGAVAVVFLLMWGVTGASFEFPVVERVWLALTGGTAPDPHQYDFEANHAPRGAPELTLEQASRIALARVPGTVTLAVLPTADTPYYALSIQRSYDPYRYEQFSGDGYVYIDGHDASHVKVAAGGGKEAVSNTVYDKLLEPSHFGWLVNGWWRIGWAIFGLAPLLLATTGVSTWLIRRRSKRNRAAARADSSAITSVGTSAPS